MNNTIIWMLVLSVFSIYFGLVLVKKEKPYNTIIASIHKIFSFALGLIYILIMYMHFRSFGVRFLPLSITIITIISFIVSVVSGSILISVKTVQYKMKIVHRISSLIAYVLGLCTIFVIGVL